MKLYYCKICDKYIGHIRECFKYDGENYREDSLIDNHLTNEHFKEHQENIRLKQEKEELERLNEEIMKKMVENDKKIESITEKCVHYKYLFDCEYCGHKEDEHGHTHKYFNTCRGTKREYRGKCHCGCPEYNYEEKNDKNKTLINPLKSLNRLRKLEEFKKKFSEGRINIIKSFSSQDKTRLKDIKNYLSKEYESVSWINRDYLIKMEEEGIIKIVGNIPNEIYITKYSPEILINKLNNLEGDKEDEYGDYTIKVKK